MGWKEWIIAPSVKTYGRIIDHLPSAKQLRMSFKIHQSLSAQVTCEGDKMSR